MKLLILVAIFLGDTVVTPPPCNASGVCSTTITAPDVCTNGGSCLSDAGAGGGGGITNPYPGTFIADAGVFNSLCLVDGGCISQFPGQVLTGWDGGFLGNLGLNFHCEAGFPTHSGTVAFQVLMATPFLTNYNFCDCQQPTTVATLCSAVANDGGIVTITDTGTGNNQYKWWCCGL